MTYHDKIKLLESLYSEVPEMELVLNKLLEMSVQNVKNKVSDYEKIMHDFENKYSLKSDDFYREFEAGRLGDSADFMEWSGIYELYSAALRKISTFETAA